MGIVARGAEGLSSQSRWQREAQRRKNGIKTPDVHRDREKRDKCPTGQGPQTPVDTHVPPRALEGAVTVSAAATWEASEGS